MSINPEAFRTAILPPETEAPSLSLVVHDEAAMQQLIDAGFGRELEVLSEGCALDRPTGQSYLTPAEELFGVNKVRAKEANRTSANAYLADLVIKGGDVAYASFTDAQRKQPAEMLRTRSFTEGHALVKRLLADPEDRLLFDGLNIYSDIGKTDKLIEWARTVESVRESKDHDRIIATLMQPEHAEARQKLIPSFDRLFRPEQQESIRKMISCDFHLPQVNNGQAIAKNLEPFYDLSQKEKRILLAQEVFDIAGAQGDTVANGTRTINESMYRRLRGQIGILLSDDNAHLPPEQRAQDDYNQILAFHAERFGLDFDLQNPDEPFTRAMVRLGMMFRDLSDEQIRAIPAIVDTKVNPITKGHLLNFLNATGYETGGQGAIMSMYSSTAAAKLFKEASKTGLSFEDAMIPTVQFIARLNEAARRCIDITDAPITHLVARDLAEAADKDWTALLRYEIVAQKTAPGQGTFALRYPPTLSKDRTGDIVEASPSDISLLAHNGLWIAGGGGGDVYVTGFLANTVFQQNDPAIISVWGEPDKIRNAQPIGDSGRIFEASADTEIINTRHMEQLVAARGLRTILVCLERRPDGTSNLPEDFLRVADYLNHDISHIALVDTGGDILDQSSLQNKRPERDHLSMQAALLLQQSLGKDVAGNLLVAAPGVDASEYMGIIAEQAGVRVVDLSPYGNAFVEQADQDNIMTDDPDRYSRMLQSLWYALHPETAARRAYITQPLLLPPNQAFKDKKARPAFTTINEQMSQLHVYNLGRVANITNVR